MQNADFIGHLIELIRIHQKEGIIDFPKEFYRELLQIPVS